MIGNLWRNLYIKQKIALPCLTRGPLRNNQGVFVDSSYSVREILESSRSSKYSCIIGGRDLKPVARIGGFFVGIYDSSASIIWYSSHDEVTCVTSQFVYMLNLSDPIYGRSLSLVLGATDILESLASTSQGAQESIIETVFPSDKRYVASSKPLSYPPIIT